MGSQRLKIDYSLIYGETMKVRKFRFEEEF